MRSLLPLLLVGAAATVAHAQQSMHLRSPSFVRGGRLPARYTCQGVGVAPALDWSNPPAGTKSIAILVDDPDAPSTFTHWLAYDITPAIHALPVGGQLPPGAVQGYNSLGGLGYIAPCPPAGAHHYVFHVYALDTVLPRKVLTRDQFVKAIQGHVTGYGEDVAVAQKLRGTS